MGNLTHDEKVKLLCQEIEKFEALGDWRSQSLFSKRLAEMVINNYKAEQGI